VLAKTIKSITIPAGTMEEVWTKCRPRFLQSADFAIRPSLLCNVRALGLKANCRADYQDHEQLTV
jgi:hypothetical protein